MSTIRAVARLRPRSRCWSMHFDTAVDDGYRFAIPLLGAAPDRLELIGSQDGPCCLGAARERRLDRSHVAARAWGPMRRSLSLSRRPHRTLYAWREST